MRQIDSCSPTEDNSDIQAFSATNAGWFAVFTVPNHEKKVAEHCHYREIERFLPTYQCRRAWKNRQTVNLDLPLFPSYLFVRIQPAQRPLVLGIPGVLNVLGGRRLSSELPEHYIGMLRTGTALQRIVPYPDAAVGDKVRITAGPMAGIEGVLTEFRSSARVVVSIELIRQSIAIEVLLDEVTPLGGRPLAHMNWRADS